MLQTWSIVFLRSSRKILLTENFSCSCKTHNLKFSSATMNLPQRNSGADTLLLLPPACVRGMVKLDRDLFSKTIDVPVLEIDVNTIKIASKKGPLKKYLLKLDSFKPLQNLDGTGDKNLAIGEEMISPSNTTKKVVVLNPKLINLYSDIEEKDREFLQGFGVTESALRSLKLTLTYENWKADEILKAVLPENQDSVTSYSKIGHIIHLNLRDHLVNYKQIIGQVLLDKISGARTIVNKLDIIDNTYRNFQMEILCGENDMMAQVRENHCVFEFDFSSVYWNPRLCTEHERIVAKMKAGDVLYDVFSGVGPFAIPVARKKCFVLANDLNPESYKWLQHNAKLNKVTSVLNTFNKDGADFIKEDVKKDMIEKWMSGKFVDNFMHITMNLPALAETFLGVFYGLFSTEEIESFEIKNYPIVHLYCFTKGDDPMQLAKKQVEDNLGVQLSQDLLLEISNVRNVSPKKEMMRVSFVLSPDILSGTRKKNINSPLEIDSVEPPLKKLCTEKNEVPVIKTNDGKEQEVQRRSQEEKQQ